MFCFCLQSSLLKLQTLEAEEGSSPESSPEVYPPSLGFKEQPGPSALEEKEDTLKIHCENQPSEHLANSPPELLAALTRPCQLLQPLVPTQSQNQNQAHSRNQNQYQNQTQTTDPVLQPSIFKREAGSDGDRDSDEGGGVGDLGGEDEVRRGGEDEGKREGEDEEKRREEDEEKRGGAERGALLHHITDGHIPLPSPRCHSLSYKFNTDPDAAPSPPCSQQYILSRSHERLDALDEVRDASSIPLLTRHIQTVKKKIRKFEERFEQEMNYKPSHNDKSTHPEMLKLMTELAKSRRQLKDLKLKQSVYEIKGGKREERSGICRSNNNQQGSLEPQQQNKPTLEETVESLFKRLREKRQTLGVPENMKEMSERQMALEKVTLQRCLLYFESLHGRPGTKQERNLVKPLYDRYQMIKHLLRSSTNITTIEEEEGSDEDYIFHFRPVPPPRRLMRALANEEDSDRDSDTAFVSPLDEVKAVRQQPAITMANLHEASRSELLESLRETRKEKKRRSKVLKEFEEEYFRQTGRNPQKEDRTPMVEEYQEYKNIKAKLRLLEVLLSKQEVSKTI